MAFSFPALINGKSYEWADIAITILGQVFKGVTKISYDLKRDIKNVKGSGAKNVSRIYGSIEPEGSVTLLMEEVERIMDGLPPGASLHDIPEFPIVITYVDAALISRVHTLTDCRFMGNPRSSERGSGEIECELPLCIGDIKYK